MNDKLDLLKMVVWSQPGAVQMILNRPNIPKIKVTHTEWDEKENVLRIVMTHNEGQDYIDVVDCLTNPKLTVSSFPDFFRSDHLGSGAIGVALLGLPTLLLCSPFIAAHNSTIKFLEKRWGMSHRYYAIYSQLKNQLDKSQRTALKRALINLGNDVVSIKEKVKRRTPF